MIASELINRIARSYRSLAKESPQLMRNMIPDFSNKEFVKLLLAGWNSGYSRAKYGGVQYVARWLAKRGIPVTHDNVFIYAGDAGASKWLRGDENTDAARKRRWQRGVASLYFKQPDYSAKPPKNLYAVRGSISLPLIVLMGIVGLFVVLGGLL